MTPRRPAGFAGARASAFLRLTVFAAVLAAGASAGAAPVGSVTAAGGWTMYGHDASGDRSVGGERTLTAPAVARGIGIRWRFSSPGGPVYGTPAIADGVLYDADVSGDVFALNAADGSLKWIAHPTAPTAFPLAITSSPLLTATDVVVGDQSGFVWALDRVTGRLHWVQRPNNTPRGWPAIWGSPTLASVRTATGRRSLILVPVASNEETFTPSTQQPCCFARGSVAALEPATGAVVWQTYTITPDESAAGAAGASVWTAPAYDERDNLVIVTTGNNFANRDDAPTTRTSDAFLALDAATGKMVWANQRTTGDTYVTGVEQGPAHPDYDFADSPEVFTVGRRTVVAAGQKSGVMSLVEAATGRLLDERQFLPSGELGGFFADSAEADGLLYGDGNTWPGYGRGEVGGLLGLIVGAVQSPPAADGGHVVAIDTSGGRLSQRWRFTAPGKAMLGGTAVAGGVVWVHASQQGVLYALEAQTGRVLAHVMIGPAISGPAIAGGSVYVAYGDTMGFAAHDPTTGGIVSVGVST